MHMSKYTFCGLTPRHAQYLVSHLFMYIHIYTFMFIYIYVFTYSYTYIYLHIHTHILCRPPHRLPHRLPNTAKYIRKDVLPSREGASVEDCKLYTYIYARYIRIYIYIRIQYIRLQSIYDCEVYAYIYVYIYIRKVYAYI